jgi:hypothetical protein
MLINCVSFNCWYVWQFDEVIDEEGNPIEEGLRKMVDPRLGDNYSIDSINKVYTIYES